MRVIYLARALLLDWLRSKTGVFFTILFPIMLMGIMSAVFNSKQIVDIYVQNLDYEDGNDKGRPTQLSTMLIDALRSSNAFNIKYIDASVDAVSYVSKSAAEGKSIILLVIPKGFDESIRQGSMYARMDMMISTLDEFINNSSLYDKDIQGMNKGKEELAKFFNPSRDSMMNNNNNSSLILLIDSRDRGYEQVKGVIENVIVRFQQRALGMQDIIKLEVKDTSKGYSVADYYLSSILAAWVMTNGVVGVSSIVTEFKRRGLLKRFMSTPLTRLEWILSNMLTQTMLAMILAIVMVVVAHFTFNTSIPSVSSMFILVIGALCFTGLGMLIAGALRDVEAVSGASNALAFPMMFLSGTFWPLEMMPDYMQIIAKAFPLTYYIQALKVSMIADDILIILYNSLILIIFTMVFVVLGSYLTRWKQE
jgi:ABC-2 type transport system permease protein